MDPRLAADGVIEVATMFLPRQVRLGRISPLQGGLRIVLTDAPETAVLAGDGTDRDAPTDATITDRTAADVLLVLGRAELSTLAVDGDPEVARLGPRRRHHAVTRRTRPSGTMSP